MTGTTLLSYNQSNKRNEEAIMQSIPQPLVRANQWFLVISVFCSWIFGQAWILSVPLLVGISGLLFNYNPVMVIGRHFLKKPLSSYIPEDKAQQQFNQIIAVTCLAIGYVASFFQWTIVMYIATGMVFLAAAIALMGFCVGCFIRFRWSQYQYRRKQVGK